MIRSLSMAAGAEDPPLLSGSRKLRTLVLEGGAPELPPRTAATSVLALDSPWPAPAESFDSVRASLAAWNSLTPQRRLDLWGRLRLGGELQIHAAPAGSGAEPVPPPEPEECRSGFERPAGEAAAAWRTVKLSGGPLELAGLRAAIRELLAVPSRLQPLFEGSRPPGARPPAPDSFRLLGGLGDRDEFLYHPLLRAASAPPAPLRAAARPPAFEIRELLDRLIHLRRLTGSLIERTGGERWLSPVRSPDGTLCSLAFWLRRAAEAESAILDRLPSGPL